MPGMAPQTVAIASVQLLVLAIMEMEHSPSSCLCTERMLDQPEIKLQARELAKSMLLFHILSPSPIHTSFPVEPTCAPRRSFMFQCSYSAFQIWTEPLKSRTQ